MEKDCHYSDEDYYKQPIKSNDFDVLIFTQHWPQTVCFVWKEGSTLHNCSFPEEHDEWTIHGIWPSQYHKMGPQFCNKSMPFNPAALQPIEQELEEKWIDIECGKTSTSLWRHEWEKHGTCAAVLEPLNSEIKFFRTGLDLLNRYDMKDVLAKANITPGQTYSMTTIFDAINHVLGKRGVLICRKNKNTGESYIFEIRICFEKNMELTNCDGVYGYPTNCDSSVIYPGEVPQRYNVIQA
ncbi:unnamed protein product [Xylocopa violacea]|uniref:Uncharacterized protein n=1 Tax=Xylocopa violacea TaxID=135666 RepID=A0ABP1N131_XYLVO